MVSVPSELSAWGPLEGLRRKESVMVGEGAEMGDKVGQWTLLKAVSPV